MIDRDGDGKIMTEDLERLLGRLGAAAELPSREELTLMLSEVDRDGSGCISLEGFHAIGSAFAPPACDGEMREAFDFFASDRDGRITATELFRVFRTIGDAECMLEDCQHMIRGWTAAGRGSCAFRSSAEPPNEGRDEEGEGDGFEEKMVGSRVGI
ncbi:probable calcium-binding protein cml36 [Phtheirospermum japonicum]|uniref:Probable calcium-binding protein cml36 n=1 Tax=Phtheirospermum japonicum TaxID=374723 RepID=A0A830CHV2_9LAMI|nr:probable calcium-binding protein cml36 [Phtheirospermum japonicum]